MKMIHLVIGGARRTGRVLAVVERGDLHALVDRQSKQKLCPQPRKPTASSATSSVQIPQAIVLAPPARCLDSVYFILTPRGSEETGY